MAEELKRENPQAEIPDWDSILKLDTPATEETKRKWQQVMAEGKRFQERKRKIAEALQAEEKKTGKPIPFTLKMRYGLIPVMPSKDEDLKKFAEEDRKLPEMAQYEQLAQELNDRLKAEQTAQENL